jgi:drug/metabolite transporter (DMT)-like permease
VNNTTRPERHDRALDRGLVLLLTPVLWGASFPAAKLALEHLGPFAFMAWTRLLGLATIAAAVPLLARQPPSRRDLQRLGLPGLLLGALIFGAYILQTVGLELTTATNAGFITGLYVVFTPLLGVVLFREAVGRAVWSAVVLSVAGLALLSTTTLSTFRPHLGDLLVLASAVAWAGHVVALGRLAPRYPTRLLALAQMAATAGLHLGVATFTGLEARAAWSAAPLLVITGVLGSGVAYTLQIVAQRELSPARAAVILSGESLASAVLSLMWLGERLRAHQWAGALLIMSAMVLSETSARRAHPAPVPAGADGSPRLAESRSGVDDGAVDQGQYD